METAATFTAGAGGVTSDEVFSAHAVQASGARAVALLAEAERLTAEAVNELGFIDRASLSELWGYASTRRLVAHRTGRTNREANDLVAVARHTRRHPATGAALAGGEISMAQAAALARAARGFDDTYAKHEPQLLAACHRRDADSLARLVAQWRHRCDDDKAATDAEHRFNTRGLTIRTRLDGSSTGTFQLDPVAAATVAQALTTRPDPTGLLHEPRTLAQRQADKLTDICHLSLHGDEDFGGGEGDGDDVDGPSPQVDGGASTADPHPTPVAPPPPQRPTAPAIQTPTATARTPSTPHRTVPPHPHPAPPTTQRPLRVRAPNPTGSSAP